MVQRRWAPCWPSCSWPRADYDDRPTERTTGACGGHVTAQLHYDVTLLRLCSLMGITCEPDTIHPTLDRAPADPSGNGDAASISTTWR